MGHPFYREWRDSFAEDPRGERAFMRIVGESPAQASEKWASWVLGIDPHAEQGGSRRE
jgi:hypothetical protein